MSYSLQFRVIADTSASIGVSQKEVDYPAGHDAVGEPFQLVKGAVSQMQAATIISLLIEQLKTEGVSINAASNLQSETITHIFQLPFFISCAGECSRTSTGTFPSTGPAP